MKDVLQLELTMLPATARRPIVRDAKSFIGNADTQIDRLVAARFSESGTMSLPVDTTAVRSCGDTVLDLKYKDCCNFELM
jgi:hypothetical protein